MDRIELLVEFGEVRDVDARQHHTSETAVRMIEAPRRGDDPLAARTAFDRSAEQCAAVSTRAVLLEVVAVAVVQAGQIDVLGGGQPAAGFVVDEDAADPLPVVLARLKESLDLGQCAGARSADLYAIDHTGEDGVRKFEHVLGVLVSELARLAMSTSAFLRSTWRASHSRHPLRVRMATQANATKPATHSGTRDLPTSRRLVDI